MSGFLARRMALAGAKSLRGAFGKLIKKGDIMFFSSHIFHGVSPHHNDEVRKTLSFNINLKEVFS